MWIEFLPAAARKHVTLTSRLVHLGALGLFVLAILDGSPIPTFGSLDIVTAILAGRHREPWYEYATVATLGAVIGAYITFWMARRAGSAYLQSRFKSRKLAALLKLFEKWGMGLLAASAAIPFPFPTSLFFAAAGASNYRTRTFLAVVSLCRAIRYSLIAFLADHYGRHFIRVVRNPTQYWGWLVLFIAIIGGAITAGILINKRLEIPPAADAMPAR